MPELPREIDPYRQATPYDFLGLDRNATATEIRNRNTKLKRDLQGSGLPTSELAKKLQELEEEYSQIRVAANRVQVDFFFINNEVGVGQCRKVAESVGKPDTDVGDLIRPKRITVNHLALVDTMQDFHHQPGKVIGFHPQTTGLSDRLSIPEPLKVQFDC